MFSRCTTITVETKRSISCVTKTSSSAPLIAAGPGRGRRHRRKSCMLSILSVLGLYKTLLKCVLSYSIVLIHRWMSCCLLKRMVYLIALNAFCAEQLKNDEAQQHGDQAAGVDRHCERRSLGFGDAYTSYGPAHIYMLFHGMILQL